MFQGHADVAGAARRRPMLQSWASRVARADAQRSGARARGPAPPCGAAERGAAACGARTQPLSPRASAIATPLAAPRAGRAAAPAGARTPNLASAAAAQAPSLSAAAAPAPQPSPQPRPPCLLEYLDFELMWLKARTKYSIGRAAAGWALADARHGLIPCDAAAAAARVEAWLDLRRKLPALDARRLVNRHRLALRHDPR